MKTLLSILIAVTAGLPLFSCTCIGSSSIAEEVRTSDAIFIGQVSRIDTISILTRYGTIKQLSVGFIPELYYKGKHRGKVVSVLTNMGSDACGFSFQLGESYIVYADLKRNRMNQERRKRRYLTTNTCKRTALKSEAAIKEISDVRKGRKW